MIRNYYDVFHEGKELKDYYEDICSCLIKYFAYKLYAALELILSNMNYINESFIKKEPVVEVIIDICGICG